MRVIILLAALGALTLPAIGASPNLGELLSLRRACGADIKSLCPGIPRGNGALAQCVAAHATALSPSCSTALQALSTKYPVQSNGGRYNNE